MRKINRFFLLPGDERRMFLRSLFLLPIVSVATRIAGLGPLKRFLAGHSSSSSHAGLTDAHALKTARKANGMVQAAASIMPFRATCLERSLALWSILRRRGIVSEFIIGVRRQGEDLMAHSWLELGGVVINDHPEVTDHYASFPSSIKGKT